MPLDNAPADDLDPVYEEAGQRFGVDPNLLRAQAGVESGGNRYAISPKGALGLMQVEPATYNEMREKYPDLSPNPFHARSNIMAGAAYLRQMYDQFGPSGGVAAYNAGPGRYGDYVNGKSDLPDETNQYVTKVSDAYSKRTQQQPAAQEQPTPKAPDVRALIDRSRQMGATDDEIRTQMQKSPLLSGLWKQSDDAGIPRSDVFTHFGLKEPSQAAPQAQPKLPPAQVDDGKYQTDPKLLAMAQQDQNAPLPSVDNSGRPIPVETPAVKPGETVQPNQMVAPGEPEVTGQSLPRAALNSAVSEAIKVSGQIAAAAPQFAAGVAASTRAFSRAQIDVMQRVDAGEKVPAQDDPLGYQDMSPEQRTQIKTQMGGDVGKTPGPLETGAAGLAKKINTGAQLQAAEYAPVDPEYANQFLVKATGMLGGFVPQVAATVVGGVPGFMATTFAQNYEQTVQAALDKGAAPEVAHTAGLTSGLVNTGLMAAPAAQWLGHLGPEIQGKVADLAATLAVHAGTMVGVSQVQTLADNVIAKQTYEPDRPLSQGLGENIPEQALIGALIPASTAAGRMGARAAMAAGNRFMPHGPTMGFSGAPPEGPTPPPGLGGPSEGTTPPPQPPSGPQAPPAPVQPAPQAATPPVQPGAQHSPAPRPAPSGPSQAETVLANIAAGKPATGGVEALQAMAQGKSPPEAPPPQPVAPPPAPARTEPAPPSQTPVLDQMGQRAVQENAQAASLPNEVAPGVSVTEHEDPEAFDWKTAKVGDQLPDGRGIIAGKGITKQVDAEALADQKNGTVWPDGPKRWAVVVPHRAEPTAVEQPVAPQPTSIEQAAAQTAEPTPAQAETGNYKKGHTSVGGMPVTIETPQGAMRRGTGPDGQPWEVQMPGHYGYFAASHRGASDELAQSSIRNPNGVGSSSQAPPSLEPGANVGDVIDDLGPAVLAGNTSFPKDLSKVIFRDTKPNGDLAAAKSVIQQALSFVKIPAKFPRAGVDTLLDQAATNQTAIDTKLFGNSSDANTIRTQGFGALNVERQRMVERNVLTALHDPQIFWPIIKAVPIDVVNRLGGKEIAASLDSGDQSVLLNRLTTALNNPVGKGSSSFINTIAAHLPIAFASRIAERISANGDLPWLPGEGGSATNAGDNQEKSPSEGRGGNYAQMGADGDHLDVMLGPQAQEAEKHPAFIVDQINPATGKFDEHKTFVGYPNAESATAAYDVSFSDGSGPARRGAVNAMSFPDFKEWATNGDTTKALSYKPQDSSPEGPQSVDNVVGSGDLWNLPREQLESMLEEKAGADSANMVRALGSEKAVTEFKRLDRKRNSSDPDRADEGAREFTAKFGNLTEDQQRLIYGVGDTSAQSDEIRTVLDAHNQRADNPLDAGYEAALAIRSVPAAEIMSVPNGKGSPAAQSAFVRLRNAYEDMLNAGVAPATIANNVAEALVTRGGWKPRDATEVVGSFVEEMRRVAPHPEPPVAQQEALSPQQALPAPTSTQEPSPSTEAHQTSTREPLSGKVPDVASPHTSVPKAPIGLIDFLRRPTVQNPGTIHETTTPGGIKDVGGDISAAIGGTRGRPGLINNKTGRHLDDATLRAWESGYFPEHDQRPEINHLLDAIRDDHTGNRRYSIHDQDEVQAYHQALAHNSEVERLSAAHGVDPAGLTRDQFFDQISQHLSVEQQAAEIASMESAHQDAYDKAIAAGRDEGADFSKSPQLSLEELDHEYRQAQTAATESDYGAHVRGPGPVGSDQSDSERRAGQSGHGVGDVGSDGEDEGQKVVSPSEKKSSRIRPLTEIMATDRNIKGRPVSEREAREIQLREIVANSRPITTEEMERRRTDISVKGKNVAAKPPVDLLGHSNPEPSGGRTSEFTIHNDPSQVTMPGMEPSAKQAQAARDNAGPQSGQVPANEGLFAPKETEQPSLLNSDEEDGHGSTVLYSFPGMLADPKAWKDLYRAASPVIRPMVKAAGMAVDAGKNVTNSVADSLAPMRTGSVRAQAFATDFANSLRQVHYRYGEIDREITRNFTPAQRDTMGRALDAQSVFEQQIRDLPTDQQATLRDEFDRNGTGLAGMPPDQRRVVEMLNALSTQTWRRLQERGLVAPQAKAIPYYMPRQLFAWTEETGYTNVRSGQGGSGRGIEPIGSNLSTAGPMRREHLTPEETERAAQVKLGADVSLLRDIRSLPARLAYSEQAIAGVDLINKIADVGRDVGVDTVIRGDIPGLLEPADYFTIADHPSFRQWTGTGWRATHVAKEFEGPLKTVLSRRSPTWYSGAQKLKSGVMQAIMFSPFIHLGVELGRTLPVMPGKVLSLKWIKQGSTLRRNLDYMDMAIRDGVAPLGHNGGWSSDPASLADQAFGQSRHAFVRALERVHSAATARVRSLAGDTVADILTHPHQTLLWDQVFNLQMSIYDTMRSRYIAKGFQPEVAGTMAAHIANRYAGALPPEHLHKYANMASNLLLFSRSFTLGNLGVMKDMFTGAPPHIRSRIEQMAGPDVRDQAQAQMRRKAVSAVALDIGLFYLGVGLVQLGLQALREGIDNTYDKWLAESRQAMEDLGKGNPLAIFEFLPQHWNEPGKQDRVYAGTDNDSKGIYLNLPPGKVGQEFVGWWSKPGVMLVNKASPLVRPILEEAFGHDSLGRDLFPPNPQTAGDYARIAGLAVKHVVEGWGPTATIEGAWDLAKEGYQHVTGQPSKGGASLSALKILGPTTGLAQVSSGFPGGPAGGVIHALSDRQRYEWQKALPGIRDQIKSGDTDGAQEAMTNLKMPPSLQRYYIQQTINPGPSKGASRQFEQTASPEDRARRDLVQ